MGWVVALWSGAESTAVGGGIAVRVWVVALCIVAKWIVALWTAIGSAGVCGWIAVRVGIVGWWRRVGRGVGEYSGHLCSSSGHRRWSSGHRCLSSGHRCWCSGHRCWSSAWHGGTCGTTRSAVCGVRRHIRLF